MMIGAYSSPAHGYMSLDPIRDLGDDPVVALWRSGVRSGQGVPAAKGWAMLILGDGEPRAVRISARSAQDARRTAARELAGAEVVLLEGVYRGRVTVFRRTETLRAMSVGKAAGDDTVQLVGSSGVLIEKSLSPADPVDARLIARRLAGQLRHQERLMFGPKLKAYMDKLNVDWANMDATATSRALAKIRTDMRAMVGPAARKLMPTWKITVESTVTKVFGATRKVVRDNFLPTVGLSLRQPDLVAVRTIADQQGWWMRDAAGVRSDQLTKKARGIVQQGLKDGLGRIEIARSLRTALPKAWQAMGARYFNAVASVTVSRARSYSEVSGYVEVGIEALEVQAVLDERTTEVCFFGDTKISTPSGKRSISLINTGEYVIAGSGKARRVVATMQRNARAVLHLHTLSGRHIIVTPNHPFMTNSGWIKAEDLKRGDYLAEKRTAKTRCLGHANMRKVRRSVRGSSGLCETRPCSILLGGMLERITNRRPYQRTADRNLRHLRHKVPDQAKRGAPRKDTAALLKGMFQKTGTADLPGMRRRIRGQANGDGKVLLHCLQGEVQGHDKCGGMGCGRTHLGPNTIRTRVANRSLFGGFLPSEIKGSTGGGRRVLAFKKNTVPGKSHGRTSQKGASSFRGRIYSSTNPRRGDQGSSMGTAKERNPGSYLRGATGFDEIVSSELVRGNVKVFNLEVEGDPTYIAEGVIVHNCRCLDGQIIDTHVVSQQIVGAMNVATPEDIKTASPFIRQVLNRETGVKSLVTTSGVKIADVVRSGMGRADDRGQFNRYRANNQLADANIGPPPYHHLCRSWTIPVTSTVQVPRKTVPRAGGGVSPTPPRPVPRGGRIPMGVGQRPQVAGPQPTPARPRLTGDPDLIERYPFTEDFIGPARPAARRFTGGKLNVGATYQRYNFDASARAIRAVGREVRVAMPNKALLERGKSPLSHLGKKLTVKANTSGVVMHIEEISARSMREIVLAEWRQPAARRVYAVRASSSGEMRYIKFNHDAKAAARHWKRQLRASSGTAQIERALVKLEEKGFVQITKDPSRVTFGSPAPKMPPKRVPKPTVPKKQPPLAFEPKPKPKPTVTHPRMPGQPAVPRPKPKAKPPGPNFAGSDGAKDYSEYGLLNQKIHPLKEQVRMRSQQEAARIKDALAAIESKMPLGTPGWLIRKKRGEAIRDFIKADTGTVEHITGKMVKKHQTAISSQKRKTLLDAVRGKVRDKSMKVRPGKISTDVMLKKLPPNDVARLMNNANDHLSQRILDQTKQRGFPTVYRATNTTGGGYFLEPYNTIVLPDIAATGTGGVRLGAKGVDSVFKHEFNHYVDQLGRGRQAGVDFREMFQSSSKTHVGPGGWKYVEGKWADKYTGRIYDFKTSEVSTTFAETLGEKQSRKLIRAYDANPEHAGFYLAEAKGAFIP